MYCLAGFLSKGDVVMDKSRVRRHFALGWFVPDLLSSLPYDALALLAMNADKHSPKAIGLRAVRLLTLLRWPRLWKYVQRWVCFELLTCQWSFSLMPVPASRAAQVGADAGD